MRRQARFEFRTWGGKRKGAGRKGAGRKRVAKRAQVPHRKRERVNPQHPILVTTPVQANHLHLIVEAASSKALARAMKGLLVSIAKRLNSIAGRKGRVFADRYHTSMLATPTQTRNALAYTLLNFRKHGDDKPNQRLDPYSSAFALPDWTPDGLIPLRGIAVLPVALPQTWLLREGWRRAGSISPWARPGGQK
jgi:hypothetical protein